MIDQAGTGVREGQPLARSGTRRIVARLGGSLIAFVGAVGMAAIHEDIVAAQGADAMALCSHTPVQRSDSPAQQPTATATPSTDSGFVWLPALHDGPDGLSCTPTVVVQNVGRDPSRAAIVLWAGWDHCPPDSAGPLLARCSGLLRPGSSWTFAFSDLRSSRGGGRRSFGHSAVVMNFITRPLSKLGVDLGFTMDNADYLCETLFFGIEYPDDVWRLSSAILEGKEFAGVPMDRGLGGPIAVEVRRECEGVGDEGWVAHGSYAGVADRRVGRSWDESTVYEYAAPMVWTGSGGGSWGWMMVQNASRHCASVAVDVRAVGTPIGPAFCTLDIGTLPPGERKVVDLRACPGAGGSAAAVLRSDQPLAVVVDTMSGAAMSSYGAVLVPRPGDHPRTPDEIEARSWVAPLLFREREGWTSRLHVQAVEPGRSAQAVVELRGPGGQVQSALPLVVPAWGGRTVDLAEIEALPAEWIGSATVRSDSRPGEDRAETPPATLAIVVEHRRVGGAGVDSAASHVLSEVEGGPASARTAGGPAGGGVVALPSLVEDEDGVDSRFAIVNLTADPGRTEYAILLFDANGYLGAACEALEARSVASHSLDSWPHVPRGFRGSALVSAVSWQHAGPGEPPGGDARRARLAAVTLRLGGEAEDRAEAVAGLVIDDRARTPMRGVPGVEICGQPARAVVTPTAWPPLWTPRPTPTTTPGPGQRAHLPVVLRGR